MGTSGKSKTADANVDRVVEAVLILIEVARGMRKPVSQFDILSALFIADCRHLDARGSVVTSDDYVAMEGGPVHSAAYDLLKDATTPSGQPVPWSSGTQPARRAITFSDPARPSDMAAFTASEYAALVDALRTVKELGYGDTLALTKSDPAYRSARLRGSGKARPMVLVKQDGKAAAGSHGFR